MMPEEKSPKRRWPTIAWPRRLCDAEFTLRGTRFGVPEQGHLLISGENAALASAIRMRIGLLLLEANKPAEAEAQFQAVRTATGGSWWKAVQKGPLTGSLLPNPELPAGAVPLSETADTLRLCLPQPASRMPPGPKPEKIRKTRPWPPKSTAACLSPTP